MLLIPGAASFRDIVRGEITAQNAGLVNFQALTEVAALATAFVTVGDVLMVTWSVLITIGINSGVRGVQIGKKAGTASIAFVTDKVVGRFESLYNAGAGNPVWSGTFLFSVTVSGSLDLALSMDATVAGSSVAAGDGELRMYVLRGQ